MPATQILRSEPVMLTKIRRCAVTAAVAVGLIGATAGPVAAGIIFANHCTPVGAVG